MRTKVAAISVLCLAFGLLAAPAQAQYKPKGDRATGETYHVEIGAYVWNPDPDIVISSEGFGLAGTTIDFVTDLGIQRRRFGQIRAVLRPAKKHKLRFEYTPIRYEAEGSISRTLIFNGIEYPITLPVTTDLKWHAFRFGYEWDFLYTDRGFLGLVLEMKYTDVQTTLSNVLDTEFVQAHAPIPAIGAIGRVYVAPNISITGEFTGFKLPDSLDEDYGAEYFDFDLYGTINFTDHVGAQLGYRSFNVLYKVDEDQGELNLKGLYFGGAFRF